MHTLLVTREVAFLLIYLCIKTKKRAQRASYRLLKHKTNNHYMYTLFTK